MAYGLSTDMNCIGNQVLREKVLIKSNKGAKFVSLDVGGIFRNLPNRY